jgi:hypothetical protein
MQFIRSNLKDVLDFAANKYPRQTKAALIHTMKRRGNLRGMGDTSSGLPDLSYLSTDAQAVDVITPATTLTFGTDGMVSTPAMLAPASGSSGSSITDSIMSVFNNLTAAVPNLLTAYTANKQLDACAKTNQARLSAGLPAIDCSAFAPTANVGVAPSTQKLLTYALIGGGGLILLSMMMRRHA